jgi:hypothetical protein
MGCGEARHSLPHRRIIRPVSAVVRRDREGREIVMKRAMILALVLLGALAPVASVAYAGTNTATGNDDLQAP